MSKRETITLTLKISAPAGMHARAIKREVLTRINQVTGHYCAFSLGLPDSAEDWRGLRVKAKIARAKATGGQS